MKKILLFSFLLFLVSVNAQTAGAADWDLLSEADQALVNHVLEHWATWVPVKKGEGTAPLMTFEELYSGLGVDETNSLDRVRQLAPVTNEEDSADLGDTVFERLENEWIEREGRRVLLDPQFLPAEVHQAYEKMMRAMEMNLNRRLWVESGYRSPAYQLYTFLFYLPKHHYSLVEARHWVALPGQSEHGNPSVQAIDFINSQGINGDDPGQSPEDFENLPEYVWLQEHAAEYGFYLSYPRGQTGITFEPWHWHYQSDEQTVAD